MIRTILIIIFLNGCNCLMAQTKPIQNIDGATAQSTKTSAAKKTKIWQSNLSLGLGGSLYNIKIGGEPLLQIIKNQN